jgi:cytochrome c oxidase subunit 1
MSVAAAPRRSAVIEPGLLRAVLGAVIGFAVGGGLAAFGLQAEEGQVLALGYLLALLGFLLGIGAFRFWLTWAAGREIDAADEHAAHGRAGDWQRYLRFTTDHKVIGIQYLVTAFALFLTAGTVAMLMRFELAQPGIATSKDFYNTIMSTHGAMMITVALVSIIGGLGNYLVPLMVGARDMAFPKANALSYWMLPLALLLVAVNPLLGGFDTGWTAYPPLSQQANLGQQAYLMAFVTIGVSSILSAINFLVTVFRMRAPGMSLMRMPIFVWAMTVTASIVLVATSVVAAAFTMLLADRLLGTSFFRASRGGDVILFQHLFWFYSHPAVYIMALPGLGAILEIVPVFARKPLFAYPLAVLMFISIGVMSFMVWAHHMFVSGMAEFFHIPIMLTTELISVPTGIVFLCAVGTIWMGRIHFKVPMLWVFGFLWAFLIGGITGVFLADVPTDITLSDTYFVVAHFHYTIVGGTIFGLFAGTYYWFPKMTGRMYDERLGRLHFWWFTLAFNATFIPMFWLGIEGMRRRVADYPPELGTVNLFVSLAGFNIFLSMVVFVFNMVRSWRRVELTVPNPWRAQTLEWQVASPPPVENFDRIPTVTDTPYQYGGGGTAPAPGRPSP